jgi:hypothetical protein
VPGLRHEHGVDGAVGQREGLGRAVEDGDAGQHPGELPAHPGGRLDGDDVEAALHEQPGQLARARREVDDAARAGRQQPVDGRLGVGGPHPLVQRGLVPERRPLPLPAGRPGFGHVSALP